MASNFFKPKPVTSIAPDWYEKAVAAVLFVLAVIPRVWLTARDRDLASHRGTVRGLAPGAPIVAGYFTLPDTRLVGHWLFG